MVWLDLYDAFSLPALLHGSWLMVLSFGFSIERSPSECLVLRG